MVWFCCSVLLLSGVRAQTPAEKERTGSKIVEIGAADAADAGKLPALTRELAQRASAAVSRRDWPAARAAYQEMVDAEPSSAPALANLGAVEYQMKEYDAAIAHLEKALREAPGLGQTWLTLGMIYYEKEDHMRALSAISRAVAERPEDPRAHNHLAAVLKGLGWIGAAESELQRALDLDPQYAEAHFNLAITYLERRPPATELARRHYLLSVELGTPRDGVVEKQLNETPSEEIIKSSETSSEPAQPPATKAKTKAGGQSAISSPSDRKKTPQRQR